MTDFGLQSIRDSSEIVFVDTCVFDIEPFFSRQEDLSISGRELLQYVDELAEGFSHSFRITPGVSEEIKGRGADKRVLGNGIPAGYKRRVKNAYEIALKKGAIQYTEDETRVMEDAALYFKTFKQCVSPTDFEMLTSAVAVAQRGPISVLTNDFPLINVFEMAFRYLNKGYLLYFDPVPNAISVYSIFPEKQFKKRAGYVHARG
ncbi:MAG: hypothetical protein AABX14_04090 [Candidatus Aenigmatarchaeota archaeon]